MEQPKLITEEKGDLESFMGWMHQVTQILARLEPDRKYSSRLMQTILDFLEFMSRDIGYDI